MQTSLEAYVDKALAAQLDGFEKRSHDDKENTPPRKKSCSVSDSPNRHDPLDFEIFSESDEGDIKPDDDDDLLAELAKKFSGSQETGPPMPEKLAIVVKSLFDNKLPEEKTKG